MKLCPSLDLLLNAHITFKYYHRAITTGLLSQSPISEMSHSIHIGEHIVYRNNSIEIKQI